MPRYIFPSDFDGAQLTRRTALEGGPILRLYSKPARDNGVRRMVELEGDEAMDALVELNAAMGGEPDADGHERAERLGIVPPKKKGGKKR